VVADAAAKVDDVDGASTAAAQHRRRRSRDRDDGFGLIADDLDGMAHELGFTLPDGEDAADESPA
jgi:hypothetical protein